ncbi:hypothetical protein EIN_021280, partial [Entamoeba invadens IP1]|uniref:hypothetical protein n=1 Tax=Entamoeba invadens IP1 TaxID=370355 RepID=UPI0002C3F5D3
MNELLNLYGVDVNRTEVITGEVLNQILTNVINKYFPVVPSMDYMQQNTSFTSQVTQLIPKTGAKDVQKEKSQVTQPLYSLPTFVPKTKENTRPLTELPLRMTQSTHPEEKKQQTDLPLNNSSRTIVEISEEPFLRVVDNDIINGALMNSFSYFKKWTGLSRGKLVFDTAQEHDPDIHEVTAFNESVIGKENLVFLMLTSSKEVFGCYVSDSINQVGKNVLESKNFPFALKASMITGPKKFITKTQESIYFILTQESEINYTQCNRLFVYGTDRAKLHGKRSSSLHTLKDDFLDIQ